MFVKGSALVSLIYPQITQIDFVNLRNLWMKIFSNLN